MQVEIRNHPAQARNPVTDEPLVDAAGKPVPLFPDQRSIYVDGHMVAYAQPKTGNIQFTRHIDDAVQPLIVASARQLMGLPPLQGVAAAPLSPGRIDAALEAAKQRDGGGAEKR